MTVPSDAYGVVVLVVLVLPGLVYAGVRTSVSGFQGRDRELTARLLQAVAVGAALDAAYVMVLGDRVIRAVERAARGEIDQARAAGALVLAVAVPAAIAFLLHAQPKLVKMSRVPWLRLPVPGRGYDHVPTAWDKAAPALGGTWVRVRLADGKWLGGWYANASYVGLYPEPRDIYVETQHQMNKDGSFGDPVPGSAGVWVALRDGDVVEWLRPQTVQADDQQE